MPTDVEERAESQVGSADDEDRLASHGLAQPLAGELDLVDTTHAYPGAAEDPSLFEREDVFVHERTRRQGPSTIERRQHGLELEFREGTANALDHEDANVSLGIANRRRRGRAQPSRAGKASRSVRVAHLP